VAFELNHRNIVEKHEDGVLIRVFLKPGSPRLKCPSGIEEEFIVVEVSSPPVGGKANRELVRALAKLLGVSSSNVSIVKGIKNRSKVVRVSGVSIDLVKERLGV